MSEAADEAKDAVDRAVEDLGLTEEEAKKVAGEPVDTGDEVIVPAQQNVGPSSEGGGEFPDPDSRKGEETQAP